MSTKVIFNEDALNFIFLKTDVPDLSSVNEFV